MEDDSNGSGGGDGGNAGDNGGGGGGSTETIASQTVEVPEDDFYVWTFRLNQSARLEYNFTVRSGPEIDFMTIERSELQHFRNGERFSYLPSVSTLASVSGRSSRDMPSGEYGIVVHNTNAGEASPPTNFDDDVVRVEVEATVTG